MIPQFGRSIQRFLDSSTRTPCATFSVTIASGNPTAASIEWKHTTWLIYACETRNVQYKTRKHLKKERNVMRPRQNKLLKIWNPWLRIGAHSSFNTVVYKLKCNDCPKYYIGQTGRSFKTWYTEQIKALTQLLMKSNFAEHILNTHHTYTDIKTNLEILHILSEGPKLNTSKQYEIYKHYKQSPTNVLNDQIHYKSHKLFDTIKHSSHNNISAILKTMNRNIAASSTWTVKHWKRCTWHRKASAKISSKLKFLHSEVNQLIQHILVQDQDGQNNTFPTSFMS